MKYLKPLSLQLRLTLLSAIILIFVALALTLGSVLQADTYFIPENYEIAVATSVGDAHSDNPNHITITLAEAAQNAAVSITTATPTKAETAIQSNKTNSYTIDALTLTSAAKKQFTFFSTWTMVLALLLGILSTWFVTGHALKPVKTLAATIDTIDVHNLSTRLPVVQTKDEIQQLTNSFNHMLDKLEQSFLQQRTFSSNAAHELKTPLAAIRTSLEVLQLEDSPSYSEYQETFTIVHRNADRLIATVQSLLELNNQQTILLYQSISTQALLAQLLEEQKTAIATKAITVCIKNELPILYGDEQLLSTALRNLLENAIKYNIHGGHIRITLLQMQQHAQIIIWNDGPAISPEQLPYIFEPFYRCDSSRSNKVSGSGLGLALVQTIIQQHHGTITAHSCPQEGTSFTISLPC